MAIRYNGNSGSNTHDNVVRGEFGYAFQDVLFNKNLILKKGGKTNGRLFCF